MTMRLAISMIAAFWAGAAGALPEPGCYVRVYGERHLAENPDQVVAAMRLRLGDLSEPDRPISGANIEVTLASQGHVVEEGLSGRTLWQGLFCIQDSSPFVCGVECDGGTITFASQDETSLTIRTRALSVGEPEGCGGHTRLYEGSEDEVLFKLYRVDDAMCEGFKYDDR